LASWLIGLEVEHIECPRLGRSNCYCFVFVLPNFRNFEAHIVEAFCIPMGLPQDCFFSFVLLLNCPFLDAFFRYFISLENYSHTDAKFQGIGFL
jgi:hypothetical protein